jgi:hypothetical protein
MNALGCENIRDRVYGALSLIELYGLSPIAPDYNKTPFALGVDILRKHADICKGTGPIERISHRLEDGRVIEYAEWPDTAGDDLDVSRLTANVTSGVDLSTTDEEVAAALDSRRSATSQEENSVDHIESDQNVLCEDWDWYGWPISYDAGWKLDLPPHKSHKGCVLEPTLSQVATASTTRPTDPEILEGCLPLKTNNVVIIGFLPQQTISGDWLFQRHSRGPTYQPAPLHNRALVVRHIQERQYAIVGQAFFKDISSCKSTGATEFRVCFDPEDLVILML